MSDSYLAMTDEDFLKQTPPDDPVVENTSTQVTDTTTTTTTETGSQEANQDDKVTDQTVEDKTDTTSTEEGKTDSTGDAGTNSAKTTEGTETTDQTGTDATKKVDGTKEGDQTTDGKAKEVDSDKTKEAVTTPNYEDFYKKIMTPFKANGKMIDLRSPEEAIQLMQMGANYTAKMQALVPHRKMLLMLENNGLLDEGKISYLIDLDKKNPEAIKKLIKDSGIDPVEIDTNVEPAYREGNHRVTDEEAVFRTTLDDLKSNPAGVKTLQTIHTDWDDASKELTWKQPEVLKVIHDQRESGIYDRIVAEMDRQKTLGQIAPGTPFLQSYKTVGDQMVKANAFADLVPQPAVKTQPVVVATTVATPKPVVSNNDQANAASTTRTTPKSAKETINPLAMSDDEFLKQMKNRV